MITKADSVFRLSLIHIFAMSKDNVKLSGNGAATVLKRMWDSSSVEGVITVTAENGGCCIEDFYRCV